MSDTRILYRAQAGCGCGWRGPRHVDVRQQPSGLRAHGDARAHRERTGHQGTDVRAWWTGYCKPCGTQSAPAQRAADAWAWLDNHRRSNRNHLRYLEREAEFEAIAERIVAVFATMAAPPPGEWS